MREVRDKSPEEALQRLMALCAKAEKSSGDAVRLMRGWGITPEDQQRVLTRLISERFIDDTRYCTLYVREKSRLNGWGAYKIRQELQRKGIDRDIIDESLQSLDPDSERTRLCELLERRLRTIKSTSKQQLREKLLRYGASRGYTLSLTSEVLRPLLAHLDDEQDYTHFV